MRCVAALCFLGFRNLIQNGVVFFVMKNKTSLLIFLFSHIKIDILTYVQKNIFNFVKIYSYYAFEKYVRD
jgi:hypothetical protein